MLSILGGCFGAFFSSSPPPYIYGVVVDAGSVHTSVYTYRSAFIYHVKYKHLCTFTGQLSCIMYSTYIRVLLQVGFFIMYSTYIRVHFQVSLNLSFTVQTSVYTYRSAYRYYVQYSKKTKTIKTPYFYKFFSSNTCLWIYFKYILFYLFLSQHH